MSEQEAILLQRERNALERERLALEKLDQFRVENANLRASRSINWGIFVPILVAVIGGTVSILGMASPNYFQAEIVSETADSTRQLQKETAEQELIKLAVQADAERATANMRFLTAAKLVPTYGQNIVDALDKGESFSTPAAGQSECVAPGCFTPPKIANTEGQVDFIWGNYDGGDDESHGDQNATQFCIAKGYKRARDFDVSCSGEDESAYLAWSSTDKKWNWIESGSADDYCFPLIKWVRCD